MAREAGSSRGTSRQRGKRRQAKPHALGSKWFANGRGEVGLDFRWLGRGRFIVRDPDESGWSPDRREGRTTTSLPVARKWELRYRAAWEDRDTGRQMGLASATEPVPLRRAVERYWRVRESLQAAGDLAASTVQNDRVRLRVLLGWYGDAADASRIDHANLRDRLTDRLAEGYRRSTLTEMLATFRAFFGSVGNPCAENLRLPGKKRDAPKVAWTDEDLVLLRDTADRFDSERNRVGLTPQARLALELGLATGAREGELFGLRWEDITPPPQALVWIDRQLLRGGDFGPTKGRVGGVAVVLPGFWPFYSPHRRGLILSAPDGSPAGRRGREILHRVIRRSGLWVPGAATHTTRHTYARLYLEAGGTLEGLSKSLRHSTLATTQGFYEHMRKGLFAERDSRVIYANLGATLTARTA
jgi:site-specific recombinase XerD